MEKNEEKKMSQEVCEGTYGKVFVPETECKNEPMVIDKPKTSSVKDVIISLLKSTCRENMEEVIAWMESRGFFVAPASVVHHNNFKGGLAKHALEVCHRAMELNTKVNLPINSVIICSLLHDICKSDQYVLNGIGEPVRVDETFKKGHGRRSLYILKRGCGLPLNYNEEMAIWWHMGEYEVSKSRYEKEYGESLNIPLCKLIQEADRLAALKEEGK